MYIKKYHHQELGLRISGRRLSPKKCFFFCLRRHKICVKWALIKWTLFSVKLRFEYGKLFENILLAIVCKVFDQIILSGWLKIHSELRFLCCGVLEGSEFYEVCWFGL